VAALSLLAVDTGPAVAGAEPRACRTLHAVDDSYATATTATLRTRADAGILRNDCGRPLQLVTNSAPAHGTLMLAADGGFTYAPYRGFVGTDTFTYSVTDTSAIYPTNLPPLATLGGVAINGGGYGSAVTVKPGSTNEVYGLTDRGPNVDGPDSTKVEPLPNFEPSIGLFRLTPGHAELLRSTPLRATDGTPYSGRVNSDNNTAETITDLNGNVLPPDPNGYDPEGIVAARDGTFWISDEYGPFITHFDKSGRQIGRLSPLDGSLPPELANRVANKGMEGLTITPDGKTLVGVMQNTLANGITTKSAKKGVTTRIVTYSLATRAVHEYVYVLDSSGTGVSEITALSNSTFLVDERDGDFPSATGYKKLWKVNLATATDVGPGSTVPGSGRDPDLGLLIGGKSVEQLVDGLDSAGALATLSSAGIAVAAKPSTPFLDLDATLGAIDPTFSYFDHDKVEGVAVLDHGQKLVISNDSDFGIAGVVETADPAARPFQLMPKVEPTTGRQDNGEFLVLDTTRAHVSSSATVTIRVRNR